MQISVFAGAGRGAGYGEADATRDEAWFDQPAGLAVYDEYLYLADSGNQVVRRIALHSTLPCVAAGHTEGSYGATFETWVGMPRQRGFLQDDGVDAREAYLNQPVALAFSRSGILYVSEAGNHRVRRVKPDHTIETVIGNGLAVTSGDGGPARVQSVDTPRALAVDNYGNLFIASRAAVRVVVAGSDSEAGPDDQVATIYRAAQGTSLGAISGCLAGLTLETVAGATRVHVLDACRGSWVAIDRH